MDKALVTRVALIGAGFIGVYYILRRPATGVVTQPGTSASGVPAYDPQVQSYILGAPTRSPSPSFALPSNNLGGNTYGGFTFGGSKPSFDFSKNLTFNLPPFGVAPPETDNHSCGGGCKTPCASCSNDSRFPDGHGGCMPASRGDQALTASTPAFTQSIRNLLSALPSDPTDVLMSDLQYTIDAHKGTTEPAYNDPFAMYHPQG